VPPAISKEVQDAQKVAATTQEQAEMAQQELESVSERFKVLDKAIELEQQLYSAAREKSNLAFEAQKLLEAEFKKGTNDGTPLTEMRALSQKIQEVSARFEAAREEVATRMDQLQKLQSERAHLLAERLAAETTANTRDEAARRAAATVDQLQNPFAPANMLRWLLVHGPRLLVIVLVMFGLQSLVRLGGKRIVKIMSRPGVMATALELEDRARTLVGVFQNALAGAIVVGGILMVCDEIGIAVAPLMGGAAVVGLAVAFGAQNLIRDYFYGFVILLENQYKLNDVLRIGDIAGQVERITLRVTVLRDIFGQLHFIPNGKIDSVTNMTHGWSRAVFDILVSYQSDIDQVMEVLMELADGMRRDARYSMHIIEDPEMLGVEQLGDSGVLIKFLIKTRPQKQWLIKRELLRRIKLKFDELGIEIPYPQQTLHVRGGEANGAPLGSSARA